jgi:hypothetical protein
VAACAPSGRSAAPTSRCRVSFPRRRNSRPFRASWKVQVANLIRRFKLRLIRLPVDELYDVGANISIVRRS